MASQTREEDPAAAPTNQQVLDILSQLQQKHQELEKRLKELENQTLEIRPKGSNDEIDTSELIGAIDQGTTSSRFLVFNRHGEPVAQHQEEFRQIYPNPG
jgi:glycerol kinase